MVTVDTDPIDSSDNQELRVEILRLRDHSLGLESRALVLADRVSELEALYSELNQTHNQLNQTYSDLNQNHHDLSQAHNQLKQTHNDITRIREAEHDDHRRIVADLQEANQALHVELRRHPIIRIGRAVARRLKLL